MIKFGLKQDTITEINHIFCQYQNIEKVILYGSRAKGNYKQGSDIDLTLIGENITYNQLWEIDNKIDDLLLPYIIDLSIFSTIDNPHLIEHIQRVGVIFYDRKTLITAL
jgi:predicted nucleotidyltransferase